MNIRESKRISKASFGYGLGCVGQGATYAFISTYFVIYMTNCVGINSVYAGSIMSISLLVEVFAGVLIGNMSDRCRSRMGRRKPFFLAGSVSMPIIMCFLFATIGGSFEQKFIYYLVLSICFRLSFASFEIPYEAFGADITTDYDERTRLRTISRVGSIIGNFAAYVLPLWVLDLFPQNQPKGWHVVGIIIGVICLISWLGSFWMASEKPLESSEPKAQNIFKSIWDNYAELLKLKPTRLLVIYKAAFSTAFAIYNVASIYYMKYSLGLDNQYASYVYFFAIIIFVIATPFIDRTAMRVGKSRQQMLTMFFSGIGSILLFLFWRGNFIGGALYVLIFSVAQTSFWQLNMSIFYDLAEVEEFVYGYRREGDIMSMVSVLGTVITAIIVQIFGVLFETVGFDASLPEQSPQTILFLDASFMLIPGLCFLLGAGALRLFPINKRTFESLAAAVALKREGRDYTQYWEDIRKIVE